VSAFTKITAMELRLHWREPAVVLFGLLLPVALLAGFGMAPGVSKPDPANGGLSLGQYIASIAVTLAVTIMGLTVVPTALATYREKGILRRLSASPAPPAALLGAQLVVNVLTACFATVVLLVLGALLFGVAPPADPLMFVVAFALAVGAIFGVGLLIAALAPSARAGNGIGMITMFPSLFFAGFYIPWSAMPEFMRRVSDFTPLGASIQAVRAAWLGDPVHPLHLVIMAGYAVVAGALAARFFRWS
jgi:ABC-2 type transport system permease protein